MSDTIGGGDIHVLRTLIETLARTDLGARDKLQTVYQIALAHRMSAVGGVIVVYAVPFLDKLKIDDVVGAIPVHLFAGIWGTIAVVITNPDASLVTQLTSIVVVGAFTFSVSLVLWYVLKTVIGIRVSSEDERVGLDNSELGMDSYPEFGAKS